MPRRAIVSFPELPEASPIFELRRRFDPLAELIPPHITLVFPFDSELTTEQLRDHVHRSVRGLAPFAVRLSQITGSEGEYLFLNIKLGNDAIIALHDRLYAGPLKRHLAVEHTFTPHLTVGRLADPVAFRDALALARTLDVQLDVQIADVSSYLIEDSPTPMSVTDCMPATGIKAVGSRRIELVTPLASS